MDTNRAPALPLVQQLLDEVEGLEVPKDIKPEWILTQNRIVYWWWQVDEEYRYPEVVEKSRKWLDLVRPVLDRHPGKFLNGASGLDYVGLAYILIEEN